MHPSTWVWLWERVPKTKPAWFLVPCTSWCGAQVGAAHTSWRGAQVGMVHKLVQHISQHNWKISQCRQKINHPAQILESSIDNIRESYVSHLFPCLTELVIQPSSAFCCLGNALLMPNGMYNDFKVLLPYHKRKAAAALWDVHIALGLD